MNRWRHYRDLTDEFDRLHRSALDHGIPPWAIDPVLDQRIADAFRALPLWLRVACILRRPSCWRDAVYEIRHRNSCPGHAWPDLTEWDEAHADPASGVWRLSSPCGYENWKLYAPGVGVLDQDGFISNKPTALHLATGDATDPSAHGGPQMPLEQLGAWAVPWIEQVSDNDVIEFVEGWGAPYGPNRDMYEWTAFARVLWVDYSPAETGGKT